MSLSVSLDSEMVKSITDKSRAGCLGDVTSRLIVVTSEDPDGLLPSIRTPGGLRIGVGVEGPDDISPTRTPGGLRFGAADNPDGVDCPILPTCSPGGLRFTVAAPLVGPETLGPAELVVEDPAALLVPTKVSLSEARTPGGLREDVEGMVTAILDLAARGRLANRLGGFPPSKEPSGCPEESPKSRPFPLSTFAGILALNVKANVGPVGSAEVVRLALLREVEATGAETLRGFLAIEVDGTGAEALRRLTVGFGFLAGCSVRCFF